MAQIITARMMANKLFMQSLDVFYSRSYVLQRNAARRCQSIRIH